MIIETALVELAKAGGTELFLSSSESLLKKVKTAKDIKQLFINTGEFFVDYENDAFCTLWRSQMRFRAVALRSITAARF